MELEKLNVSEECLKELKRSGINEVEDIIFFLRNVVGNATVSLRMSEKCFDETMSQLEVMGLWPENKSKL